MQSDPVFLFSLSTGNRKHKLPHLFSFQNFLNETIKSLDKSYANNGATAAAATAAHLNLHAAQNANVSSNSNVNGSSGSGGIDSKIHLAEAKALLEKK